MNFVVIIHFHLQVAILGTTTVVGRNERIQISKISGSGGALALNVREGTCKRLVFKINIKFINKLVNETSNGTN